MPPTIPNFSKRCNEEEWMDQPETSAGAFTRALEDIRWVNRHLSGAQVMQHAVWTLVRQHGLTSLNILDLGTGSADIPVALVQWARQNNLPIQVTALDLHPLAVEEARKLTEAFSEIKVIQGDALQPEFSDAAFDLTISSMFMHHLNDGDAVRLMRQMARLSRTGFVINDLERHPLAWIGIKTLGWLTGKGAIFKNDAPLSVLRGFSRAEIKNLCLHSGLDNLRVSRQAPYRWVVMWERS